MELRDIEIFLTLAAGNRCDDPRPRCSHPHRGV